ncbi:MAG: TonB-dependent receptor plug domain-containing protein [Aliidongia sp.]
MRVSSKRIGRRWLIAAAGERDGASRAGRDAGAGAGRAANRRGGGRRLNTIQVTGTRIRNTDAQAANPITVVSSEDIAKEKSTTVEDVLKKLPSIDFSGGLKRRCNNGGDGASEIGLRNLGPTRHADPGQRLPLPEHRYGRGRRPRSI